MKPRLGAPTMLPRRPKSDFPGAKPQQQPADDFDVYDTIGPRAFKGKSLALHPDNTTRTEISGAKPGKPHPADDFDVYDTIGPRAFKGNSTRTETSAANPGKQQPANVDDVYATVLPRALRGKSLPLHQDNTTRTEISGANPGKQQPANVDDVYATVLPGALRGKTQKGDRPVLSPPPTGGQFSPTAPDIPSRPLQRATTPYEQTPITPTDSSPYEKLTPLPPGQSRRKAPSAFFGDDFKPIVTVPALPPRGTPPKAPIVVFGSGNVFNLTHSNYDNFIKDKEKALVIFYDANKASFASVAREFGHAANLTKNGNHCYGAVDCIFHRPLCCQERITHMPALKLYSNGFIAANLTRNGNHCYGAVDCNFHRPLCCQEQITHTPALKLYSNGFIVSSLMEASSFTANQMNQLVTMSPVLTQPRG